MQPKKKTTEEIPHWAGLKASQLPFGRMTQGPQGNHLHVSFPFPAFH